MKRRAAAAVLIALCLSLCAAFGAAAGADGWKTSEIGAMDVRAQAVDDFYCYVNFDWAQDAVIKDGRSSVSSFNELSDLNQKKMIELLDGSEASGRDARQAQNFFKIITDMEARNAAGVEPLLRKIEEIEAISSMDELNAYLFEENDAGALVIGTGVIQDFADSTLYVAGVAQNSLLLEDAAEYTARTDRGNRIEAAKRFVMSEMYAHLGRGAQMGEALFDQALETEAMFAPHMYTTADMYDPSYYNRIYNIYTWDQLDALHTNFPLKALLEAKGVAGSPFFIVLNPDFHASFDAMYTDDNLEGFKAMLICGQVIGSAKILDQRSFEIAQEADAMISGAKGNEPLEEAAYNLLTQMLPGCLGQLFVENCFTEEMHEDVVGMTEEIIAVFRKRLENNDWLSDQTREKAIEKLDAMRINVGYGVKWADYAELEIDPQMSYYDAVQAYNAYSVEKMGSQVGTRVDVDEWNHPTHITNAGYNPQDNSINIFAGILGEPFYTPGGSIEVNLGGIGIVIGHEITHAFDASGSQFDAKGNMTNWWTEEDFAAFTERSMRVADYFSAIEVLPGVATNGVMMQGEAVADLGGVSVALEIAAGIEDFDYSVFFETYAGIWREQCTREALESWLMTDPHPSSHLRCNITLQQFEEFYETYGVEEGDGMYLAPEKRLTVW